MLVTLNTVVGSGRLGVVLEDMLVIVYLYWIHPQKAALQASSPECR